MTKQEEIREGIRNVLHWHEGVTVDTHGGKLEPQPEWCNPDNCNKYGEECDYCITDQILQYLDFHDVVIKVEKEVPAVHWASNAPLYDKAFGEGVATGYGNMLKAGYVAVEPLILGTL